MNKDFTSEHQYLQMMVSCLKDRLNDPADAVSDTYLTFIRKLEGTLRSETSQLNQLLFPNCHLQPQEVVAHASHYPEGSPGDSGLHKLIRDLIQSISKYVNLMDQVDERKMNRGVVGPQGQRITVESLIHSLPDKLAPNWNALKSSF